MSKAKSHGHGKGHKKHGGPRVEKEVSGPSVMGFGLFRKHQKAMLWIAVVFTVLVFGLFASFGDMEAMLSGEGGGTTVGRFTVPATGEEVVVDGATFQGTRYMLGRFAFMNNQPEGVSDDDVWSHLMLVEDARAHGLKVSDAEVGQSLSASVSGMTRAQYRNTLRQLGFASTREFEEGMRELLLISKYSDLLRRQSTVMGADEVYLRWKLDNERFDFEALLFPDLDPADVPDPSEDELLAFWDELGEAEREVRFRAPGTRDLVLAWVSLDTDLSTLPGDKLAELSEPPEAVVQGRWNLVRAARYPDVEEPDEEILATLATEQKLIGLCQRVQAGFLELDEEQRTRQAFLDLAAEHGLGVVDPEGELTPQEIEDLPDVGSARLAGMVANAPAGALRFAPPYGGDMAAVLAFVEGGTDSRPLAYEEARDELIAAWKDERRDQPAQDFRDALLDAARALPEAADEVAALEGLAEERAQAALEKRAEAGTELDHAEALAQAWEGLQPEVEARLDAFLGQAWEAVAGTVDVERRELSGVSKAYRFRQPEDVDRTSLDHFLRTNSQIFNRGEGGVTPVLRHPASSTNVIVRVTAITAPTRDEMFADPEGMARARSNLSFQKLSEVFAEQLDVEALKASHGLQLPEPGNGAEG